MENEKKPLTEKQLEFQQRIRARLSGEAPAEEQGKTSFDRRAAKKAYLAAQRAAEEGSAIASQPVPVEDLSAPMSPAPEAVKPNHDDFLNNLLMTESRKPSIAEAPTVINPQMSEPEPEPVFEPAPQVVKTPVVRSAPQASAPRSAQPAAERTTIIEQPAVVKKQKPPREGPHPVAKAAAATGRGLVYVGRGIGIGARESLRWSAERAYEVGRLKRHISHEPVEYNNTDNISIPLRIGGPDGKYIPAVRKHTDALENYSPNHPIILLSVQGANDGSIGNERIVVTPKGGALHFLNPRIMEDKLPGGEGITLDLSQPGQIATSRPDAKKIRSVSNKSLRSTDVVDRLSNFTRFYSDDQIHIDDDHWMRGLDLLTRRTPELRKKWEMLGYNYRFMKLMSEEPDMMMAAIGGMIGGMSEEQEAMFKKIGRDLQRGEQEDAITNLDELWKRFDDMGDVYVSGLVEALGKVSLSASSFEAYRQKRESWSKMTMTEAFGVGRAIRLLVQIGEEQINEGDSDVDKIVRRALDATRAGRKAIYTGVDYRAKQNEAISEQLQKQLVVLPEDTAETAGRMASAFRATNMRRLTNYMDADGDYPEMNRPALNAPQSEELPPSMYGDAEEADVRFSNEDDVEPGFGEIDPFGRPRHENDDEDYNLG